MEQRNANETFKEGSGAVVFDMLAKKFIKFIYKFIKFFFKGYHRKLTAKTRGVFRTRSNI